MLKTFKWIFLFFVTLVLLYICILSFPSLLYSHEQRNENLIISCDQEFPSNITVISSAVLERIKKSEYYSSTDEYHVYISNGTFVWRLVSNFDPNQGGVNYTWFRGNAFIRPSVIAENRIIPPGNGLADASERDLIYFISHEVAHGMMSKSIGLFAFQFKTQGWVKEGYADLIGKKSFNYESNLEQLKKNEKRLTESSGLYVRYHLFLLYLLNHENLSINEIINENLTQADVLKKIMPKE